MRLVISMLRMAMVIFTVGEAGLQCIRLVYYVPPCMASKP